MKIALLLLGLFAVSAIAGDVQPRSLRFKEDQIYKYNYSGHVLTGIPSGSSLYSGHQLNATVELVGIKSKREGENGRTIVKMHLTEIVLGHLLEEVTQIEKVNFARDEVKESIKSALSLPVQFTFNEENDSFQWVEVQKADAPWSVNIKKSIIDLLQVNLVGKQAVRSGNDVDEAELLKEVKLTSPLSTFGIHESTIKGECETNYQIIQTHDPTEVRDALPGAEKFYYTVTKTRNFENCLYEPNFHAHNWDKRGCVQYCQRYAASTHLKMEGLNKHLPIPDETSGPCTCDPKEAQPVDQFSTIRYNISVAREDPVITEALAKGKIVVDNHGTKFVVYTQHALVFVNEQIKRDEPLIPTDQVIRVNDLIFTLFPYKGMKNQDYPSHVIPIYNLLVPKNSHNLVAPTLDLLHKVAKIVREKTENEAQAKAPWLMTQVIHNLAHLDARDLKQIFDSEARIEESERFTNSEHSVVRQLFLDALAHVGTKATAEWLQMVIAEKALSKYELRQFVETLPRNVYAPSRTLLTVFKKQIEKHTSAESWDELAAFAVSYGKLISKACRFEHVHSHEDRVPVENRWYSAHKKLAFEKLGAETPIDFPEVEERCTIQDAESYISSLHTLLTTVQDLKGKIILAQALAHSNQYEALKHLTPYITGSLELNQCVPYVNASSHSDCHFLRSSIIYALHHMIPVSPKLLRSLVLPVFQNKLEPYELRLAAFTVFMASGPRRHELESIAAIFRGETNRQVITMVRSVLEETANLTQACNLPLAEAAREILPTLPVYNFDGVYSKASYNEWYSSDKSTGFFLNGQYVANNVSLIPRHGYLSFGSHWKSLTNSWLTIAYQQKGLQALLTEKLDKVFTPEWFMNTLGKKHGRRASSGSEKPIDELFKSLGVTERAEEDFKLKLFIKMYERTSLFTFDRYSLEAAYNEFNEVFYNILGRVNGKTDFNWVRFHMPSSYYNVVPSDIGLPIVVMKHRPHIVSLRTENPTIKAELPMKQVSFDALFVPQLFYTSSMSVSAFHHGLKKNYGVYSLKKWTVFNPTKVTVNFELPTRTISYVAVPVLDVRVAQQSNINRAFFGANYIGLQANDSPIHKKVTITSRVPSYEVTPRIKSLECGMDLEVHFKTEKPWFLNVEDIPTQGLAPWIIEKYAEFNEFNFDIAVTLRANKENPSTGWAGSFSYNHALTGDYKRVDHESETVGQYHLTKEEIKKVAEQMVYDYPDVAVNKKAPTYTRAVTWAFETLSKRQPIVHNATLYLIQSIDYQTYWVKYVSALERPAEARFQSPRAFQIEAQLARPALPSTLRWEAPVVNRFTGKYIANFSWGSNFENDLVEKIVISGNLHRTREDEVVGEEMKEKNVWYHEQCQKDKQNMIHMSYACQMVAHQESYFNKITGTITYSGLDRHLVNATEKLYTLARAGLYSYWRPWSTIAHYPEDNEENKITFEAKHSNVFAGKPVVNFEVRTPKSTALWYKLFFPINRFYSYHPIMFKKASVLPNDQVCGLMVNHVRTFDNVTYEKPSTDCEYVLAMDCSASRRFGVTIKEEGKEGRQVKVIVGKHVIIVKEVTKYEAKVDVNGEAKFVKPGQSIVVGRSAALFVQNGFLTVELFRDQVKVHTDGKLVQVVASPVYMGKTCGLCGNADQEAHMELQGPENCIYSVPADYQNAYSLGKCHTIPPTVPPTCHGVAHHRRVLNSEHLKRITKSYGLQYNEDILAEKIAALEGKLYSPEFEALEPIRKTLTHQKDNHYCFSKYAFPACRENERPLETIQVQVDLVCVQRRHPLFDQWWVDTERRVIDETSSYPVTEIKEFEIPLSCLKKDY